MKKYFVKLMSRFLYSAIHQVMWYFWLFMVNPFSLLQRFFFLKKSVFPLVFLSLAYRYERYLIWQKILEAFWRHYFSIIFWLSLWMLTSLVIWILNITVSTTLKYCHKYVLKKKLKLMGGAMKYFLKKLLGHKIFRSMVS